MGDALDDTGGMVLLKRNQTPTGKKIKPFVQNTNFIFSLNQKLNDFIIYSFHNFRFIK